MALNLRSSCLCFSSSWGYKYVREVREAEEPTVAPSSCLVGLGELWFLPTRESWNRKRVRYDDEFSSGHIKFEAACFVSLYHNFSIFSF
jgi:hypothetical protein